MKLEMKKMIENIQPGKHQLGRLTGVNKANNYYELHFSTGEVARLFILDDGIFRFYLDPTGRFDESNPIVSNLNQFNNDLFKKTTAQATDGAFIVHSQNIRIVFQKDPVLISIFDEQIHRYRMKEKSPIELGHGQTTEILTQQENEFYYGGGLQGGQFSHKGKKILIKNTNIVGAGGVINPIPFIWSNAGFGILRNTYNSGVYDFKADHKQSATLTHDSECFDAFYLIGNSPSQIIEKFYTLTGKPIMLPKYALKLGFLGNFTDTNWETSKPKKRCAIKFEDNNYYQKSASGQYTASLIGRDNYQFSAKAMIDRFQNFRFNLGWIVPNYGSSKTSDEWQEFNDYAIGRGIVPGIYKTDNSDLLPNTGLVATKQADINLEAKLLKASLANKRSFVFANNGKTGSQNQAALLFGANGGEWDSIPDQIAGLLGISLSGQPIVGSSIDGNAGGGNAQVSVRDLEWKVFTPIFFENDTSSEYSKTPFAFNNKISRINRAYINLRDQFNAYIYDLIYQAQFGNPVMRALFVEFPHERINYTEQVNDEFLLGSNILVAPITNGRENQAGLAIKDKLYLPDHNTFWIDLFTGQKFTGGRVYNNLEYSLWHLPVFIRSGAILNQGSRIFTIYPHGKTKTTTYTDNSQISYGKQHLETTIASDYIDSNLHLTINKTIGSLAGSKEIQGAWINLLCDAYPGNLQVKINDEVIPFEEFGSPESFTQAKEGYYFNPEFNPTPAFNFYKTHNQPALQIKLAPRNIFENKIEITIKNFSYANLAHSHAIIDSALKTPQQATVVKEKTTAHSLTVAWPHTFDRVQIEVNGIIYDGISGDNFTFHELTPNTRYTMRLRYIYGSKVSEWSDYFGGITKPDQLDYAVENVHLITQLSSKESHPSSYATDLLLASEWITSDKLNEENNTLTFVFPEVEDLSRLVYIPRSIDETGRILKAKVSVSSDGTNFEPHGDIITWSNDAKNKVIGLRDVHAKAIKLEILQTSDGLVAGKEFYFFRPKN